MAVIAMGQSNSALAGNLCKNPGFELLDPAGDNFPLNWSPVKSPGGKNSVAIDKDANSGSIAVRMQSDASGSSGINSEFIGVRRGTITFHYKAVKSGASGENLVMYVLGMASGGGEVPGRIAFKVPKEHVADGQWHAGSLDFDFTTNSAVGGILIGPRVNEATTAAEGEWLIDDIECIQGYVGPRGEIEALYMPDVVMLAGKPAEVLVQITSTGDQPLPESTLKLALPEGFEASGGQPSEMTLPELAPGESKRLSWNVRASRPVEAELKVEWSGKGFATDRSRHVLCVAKRDPRSECTRADGLWRLMPKPVSLQEGNAAALTPLKTRKSVDLPDNFIGVTAHLPRTKDFEVVYEPEHLIDGSHQTNWSGRGFASSVPGPADWAEVSFGSSQTIKEVRLVPFHNAEGFPIDFIVQLRVGGKWKTVHEAKGVHLSASDGQGEKKPYVVNVSPAVEANAVRIEVTRFNSAAGFFTDCAVSYYIRLSGIEAISAAGENVALASKGAKAKVAFTFRSYFNSAEVVAKTYPELYNLGVKWNRIGQWGDWTAWSMVEQKKGEYFIDPTTDKAITDSVKNGVNILYTLAYGNPLYEDTPWLADLGPVWRHGHPFTGDGGPTKPESIQGFVNYAKFVAKHFKGRVKFYEIWNEENSWAWYGSPPDPKAFGALIRDTAKALKEIDPEIKVMVGGTAALAPTFIAAALEEGGGKYLDAFAFHPYTMPYPEMGLGALDIVDGKQAWKSKEDNGYTTYAEMIAFLKKHFAKYNPNFEVWANEWNACPTRDLSAYKGNSEIVEAKQGARFFLMNTLLGVHAVWWSLANENTVYDWGVLRTGDLSRKPIYYTIQALTTLLSGAKRDESIRASVVGDAPELKCEALRGRDGETLVAVWSAVPPEDDFPGTRVDLRVNGPKAKKVDAIDTLHALVQDLKAERDGEDMVIKGLLVTDCPVIVRIR